MTGRHWFRKDVLLPIFYVLLFGAGLYWLRGRLMAVPDTARSDFVRLAFWLILAVYVLLLLITVRHVLSTYDLERYDPGDRASLKRLMRRLRFRLSRQQIPEQAMMVAIEQALLDSRYHLETESHVIGRVYCRRRPLVFMTRPDYDRVIILQHEPLNILTVDQLLQDCIRHIRSQPEKHSRRNLLILVTRMHDAADAASAAAGIVNFLGKFKGGTLCPFLIATRQFRLFYPADRTLLPRTHRFHQNVMLYRLKRIIRQVQAGAAKDKKLETNGSAF